MQTARFQSFGFLVKPTGFYFSLENYFFCPRLVPFFSKFWYPSILDKIYLVTVSFWCRNGDINFSGAANVELRWENVTVTAGKGDESKTILSDVTGRVKQGMVTDLIIMLTWTSFILDGEKKSR